MEGRRKEREEERKEASFLPLTMHFNTYKSAECSKLLIYTCVITKINARLKKKKKKKKFPTIHV